MNLDDDILLLAIAVWAISRLASKTPEALAAANRSLQQGGAKIYEQLHPSERAHEDKLPGHQLSRVQLLELMTRTGFPDPNMATAIALAESGGVPNAIGDGGISIGIFQINTRAWPMHSKANLADPEYNAKAAYAISKGGTNWKPWSVFKSGRYRKFL